MVGEIVADINLERHSGISGLGRRQRNRPASILLYELKQAYGFRTFGVSSVAQGDRNGHHNGNLGKFNHFNLLNRSGVSPRRIVLEIKLA